MLINKLLKNQEKKFSIDDGNANGNLSDAEFSQAEQTISAYKSEIEVLELKK